jgi:hypothetical protein
VREDIAFAAVISLLVQKLMRNQLLETVYERLLGNTEYFAEILELDDASDNGRCGKSLHRARTESIHACENRFADC